MIVQYICKWCNKQFSAHDHPSKRNTYCSPSCSQQRRVNRVTVKCINCEGAIECWPSKANTKKYCSMVCRNIDYKIRLKNNRVPITDESRKKMSESQKKLREIIPVWNKGKAYHQIRGANHHNWNGGSNERHQAMGRIEYKSWRSAVFARDNYTCQVCDTYGVKFHADHIKSWKDYPELRYEVSNGRTLCVPCHYYVTFKKKMPEGTRWGVTERERRLR